MRDPITDDIDVRLTQVLDIAEAVHGPVRGRELVLERLYAAIDRRGSTLDAGEAIAIVRELKLGVERDRGGVPGPAPDRP